MRLQQRVCVCLSMHLCMSLDIFINKISQIYFLAKTTKHTCECSHIFHASKSNGICHQQNDAASWFIIWCMWLLCRTVCTQHTSIYLLKWPQPWCIEINSGSMNCKMWVASIKISIQCQRKRKMAKQHGILRKRNQKYPSFCGKTETTRRSSNCKSDLRDVIWEIISYILERVITTKIFVCPI